jgi:hypothetical protein
MGIGWSEANDNDTININQQIVLPKMGRLDARFGDGMKMRVGKMGNIE